MSTDAQEAPQEINVFSDARQIREGFWNRRGTKKVGCQRHFRKAASTRRPRAEVPRRPAGREPLPVGALLLEICQVFRILPSAGGLVLGCIDFCTEVVVFVLLPARWQQGARRVTHRITAHAPILKQH